VHHDARLREPVDQAVTAAVGAAARTLSKQVLQ
jgi:hypothetical protein